MNPVPEVDDKGVQLRPVTDTGVGQYQEVLTSKPGKSLLFLFLSLFNFQ
jgi:hypothetical protein